MTTPGPPNTLRPVSLLARFLRRYATPHIKSYALGLFFLLATTGLTVAIPAFVELAVDALEPTGPAAQADAGKAIGLAWAIIAAGLGVMIVRTLSRVLFFNPGRVIEFHMKSDLFRHLTELPRSYYDQVRPGEVVSRGTNDAMAVRGLIGFGSLQVFNVALTLLLTIGKMLLTDWRLTFWVLVPLLLAVIVLWRAIRDMFKLTRETQETLGTISARTLELYSGATVLQTLNATPMATARFEEQNTKLLGVAQRLAFVIAWLLPIVDVVGNFCLVLLLFVGGNMVVEGTLSPGELAAFAVLIRIVAGGLNSLGWLVNALQRGWISLVRVYEVMDAPARSTDDGAQPMPASVSAEDRGHLLEVRDLTFCHPGRPDADGKPRASRRSTGVSFTVGRARRSASSAPPAAGKTTLLHMLARACTSHRRARCSSTGSTCDIALPAFRGRPRTYRRRRGSSRSRCARTWRSRTARPSATTRGSRRRCAERR